ncbi:alcohol dehydrogenase catalytic domain-containing protein [Streptomyces sp. NPDC001100]
MHAIRLHTFGPADNLAYESVDAPSPAPGQVRIAVAAAGVHLLDTVLRRGEQGPLPELPALPTVPGREVAGVVESLGAEVAGLWLGRRVVAHLGFAPGGYAESAVVDVDRVHEIPANLDFAQAVAMIGTGRTAMGIVQFTELGTDSVVIVPAAAGGLGTLLVQYAKHAGATVIGLAGGPKKTALVGRSRHAPGRPGRGPDGDRTGTEAEHTGPGTAERVGAGELISRVRHRPTTHRRRTTPHPHSSVAPGHPIGDPRQPGRLRAVPTEFTPVRRTIGRVHPLHPQPTERLGLPLAHLVADPRKAGEIGGATLA